MKLETVTEDECSSHAKCNEAVTEVHKNSLMCEPRQRLPPHGGQKKDDPM